MHVKHLIISDVPPIVEVRYADGERYGALLRRLVGVPAEDIIAYETARSEINAPEQLSAAASTITRYAYLNAASNVDHPHPYQLELVLSALRDNDAEMPESVQAAMMIAWRQAYTAFRAALHRAYVLGVEAAKANDNSPFVCYVGNVIEGIATDWEDLPEPAQDSLLIEWIKGKGLL